MISVCEYKFQERYDKRAHKIDLRVHTNKSTDLPGKGTQALNLRRFPQLLAHSHYLLQIQAGKHPSRRYHRLLGYSE
jgi:hypothetical protein